MQCIIIYADTANNNHILIVNEYNTCIHNVLREDHKRSGIGSGHWQHIQNSKPSENDN